MSQFHQKPQLPGEQTQRDSQVDAMLIIRGVYIIMLVTVVMLALLQGGAGNPNDNFAWLYKYWWFPLIVALLLGAAAIVIDKITPRKKLTAISSIVFGLTAGLLATVAVSYIIDLLLEAHAITTKPGDALTRLVLAIKAAIGITLCYLGVAVVYSTRDEFRLVIPYVEFSKQLRGTRPLVLDTSAIIDGRILEVCLTGFLAAPIIIPRGVIDELQTLSDSADRLKRNRGRRGLDIVRKLQNNSQIDLSIVEFQAPGVGVDQMLLELAREHRAHLVTTDFNLNKVASIHGVKVLNMNDLANSLKATAIPGDRMTIEIVKRGEGRGQGVGYLDDGTMVVVENASGQVGHDIEVSVTSSIQTSAGRMIFGELYRELEARDHPSRMLKAELNHDSPAGGRPAPEDSPAAGSINGELGTPPDPAGSADEDQANDRGVQTSDQPRPAGQTASDAADSPASESLPENHTTGSIISSTPLGETTQASRGRTHVSRRNPRRHSQ